MRTLLLLLLLLPAPGCTNVDNRLSDFEIPLAEVVAWGDAAKAALLASDVNGDGKITASEVPQLLFAAWMEFSRLLAARQPAR